MYLSITCSCFANSDTLLFCDIDTGIICFKLPAEATEVTKTNENLGNISFKESTNAQRLREIHLRIDAVEKQNSDISNTIWQGFHWLIGFFGLLIAFAVIIYVKDHNVAKRSIDAAEKISTGLLYEFKDKVENLNAQIEREVDQEVEVFRRKIQLHEALVSPEHDLDTVYDSIRLLMQKPKFSYAALFKKLEGIVSDDDIKKLLNDSIDICTALKSKVHHNRR